MPKAAIDAMVDGTLHGWAWSRELDTPMRVDLLHDDTVIAHAFEANAMRADLLEAGHPTGACGFCIPIPNGILPAGGKLKLVDTATGELLISAATDSVPRRSMTSGAHAEVEVGRMVGMSSRRTGDPAIVGAATGPADGALAQRVSPGPESEMVPAAPAEHAFSAKIERYAQGLLLGWAVNRLNLAETFTVELLVDGLVYDRQVNNHVRADLERNLGTPSGVGGLRFALPARVIDGSEKITCQLRMPDATLSPGMVVQQSAHPPVTGAVVADPEIAIVVPVYNAVDHVRECIDLLERHTTRRARLIMIDDASPDPEVWQAMQVLAGRPNVTLLRNDSNLGFTATCNRGIAEADTADVVLLNSDARVQPKWLEGLVMAAYSDRDIGSATPLSDRAGAFSAPELGNANRLPPGVEESEFAVAMHRRGRGVYPAVPTGNGFCMYIRRDCLDAVGALDAEAFPHGYGEENDFCMRAWRAGWRHVVADRTYVFHERNVSFGAAKDQLIVQGRSVVDERYPEYKPAIAVFRDGMQLKNARFHARLAEADCVPPRQVQSRALFVISTQTGGTPQTNRDLMGALDDAVECWVLSTRESEMRLSRRSGGNEILMRRHVLEDPVEPLTHRSGEYERVVRRWLTEFSFDLVHIRHLGWHSVELPRLARESGAAVVMSFHDYYTLCPTVKLIDGDGAFCGGACTKGSARCIPELWEENAGFPPLRNAWVNRWREVMGDALEECDAFVTTSPSARERMLHHLPGLDADRFHVIPHGRDFPELQRSGEAPGHRLKILVPGNISVAKGRDIIRDLLERDVEERLEFHVLGKHTFGDSDRIVSHGAYERDRFVERVRPIGANIGVVFSIWDETWCHTLTEMWAAGLPVAVFDFPTVATRVRENGAGWVLDHKDIDRLYRDLIRLCADPEEWGLKFISVLRWQRAAAAHGTSVMGARYLEVYRDAQDRRWRLDKPFAAPEGFVRPATSSSVVGVVSPSNHSLDAAPGSTWVRIWERTRNRLGRAQSFTRLRPGDLAAAVQAGDIDTAIIQRNALSVENWEEIEPLVSTGKLRFLLDLDDDLFSVPAEKDPTGSYARYTPVLAEIASAASAITVSTPVLAERMARHNSNIVVLPNRLSRRIWAGWRKPRRPDGTFRALYYGSATHDGDLRMILPALSSFAASHPDFRLRLIEAVSPDFAETLPDWVETDRAKVQQRNYPAFVAWLKEQLEQCDISLCPLENTEFNRFKSPLKLLESAGLGLPAIVSEHPVYRATAREMPSVLLADAELQSWVGALEQFYTRRHGLEAEGRALQEWAMTHAALTEDIDDVLREHLARRPATGFAPKIVESA